MKALLFLIYGTWLFLFLTASLHMWPFGTGVTLEVYKTVWGDPYVIEALGTTLVIGVVVSLLNVVLGATAGRKLFLYEGNWQRVWDVALSLPLLIPSLVITSGLHMFMIRAGLVDTIGSVILIHLFPTLPYSIRLFRNAYEQLGNKWYEQAVLLGANKATQFLTVSVPMLKETYRYAFLLSFVISLSQYALTAFIGGGQVTTLALLFFPYFSSANQPLLAAFAVLFTVLPLLVWLLFEWVYMLLENMGRSGQRG